MKSILSVLAILPLQLAVAQTFDVLSIQPPPGNIETCEEVYVTFKYRDTSQQYFQVWVLGDGVTSYTPSEMCFGEHTITRSFGKYSGTGIVQNVHFLVRKNGIETRIPASLGTWNFISTQRASEVGLLVQSTLPSPGTSLRPTFLEPTQSIDVTISYVNGSAYSVGFALMGTKFDAIWARSAGSGNHTFKYTPPYKNVVIVNNLPVRMYSCNGATLMTNLYVPGFYQFRNTAPHIASVTLSAQAGRSVAILLQLVFTAQMQNVTGFPFA
jgi:hypothetical protein